MKRFMPGPSVLLAAAGQTGAALYVWSLGPAGPIPAHFDFNGQIDRWGDRRETALVIAGMALLTLLCGAALDWGARRKDADTARRKGLGVAQTVLILATSAVVALHLAMVTIGTDGTIAPERLTLIGVCAIFTIIGAFVGKVAPNALVGVRTPWSLNSRLSWEKSNRLAGRLLFWIGLAGLLLAPLAPEPLGHRGVIAAVLIAGALSVFESWRVWRADPERRAV